MNHKMIDVVFQNQDFIVVNKPAGLNFHSEAETENTTQAGLAVLVKQQQQLAELYPVHRLDKMTSGLVIFALNKATAQAFQILFEQHKIQKFYLAISDKKPKKKQGWIIGDTRYAEAHSAKQQYRGYLHAFAIQFELEEHSYQFVLAPTKTKEGGGGNF